MILRRTHLIAHGRVRRRIMSQHSLTHNPALSFRFEEQTGEQERNLISSSTPHHAHPHQLQASSYQTTIQQLPNDNPAVTKRQSSSYQTTIQIHNQHQTRIKSTSNQNYINIKPNQQQPRSTINIKPDSRSTSSQIHNQQQPRSTINIKPDSRFTTT